MEQKTIEARKLEYLKAMAEHVDVDAHFEKVDAMMATVSVGSTVYERGLWDVFPKEITRILDVDRGVVETFERSINKTETKCITEYMLTPEG